MNTYRALPDNLKEYADATQKYLSKDLGLTAIKIEQEVHREIEFRPTLSAISTDKHIICAEVVEQLFAPDIEAFVLACRNHSLPVKLYVTVAKGQFQSYEPKVLKFARENGVAILEISLPNHGALITNPPVSLSLGGLRSFNLQEFPAKYREPLKQAIETFKSGNPAKGCSDVYDEIEQLTRRIGQKCAGITGGLKKNGNFDWDKESWSNVLEFLKINVDKVKTGCPNLNNQLFSRLIGMTEYRNETGHKPSSLQKKIDRDKQLRTRFESAMDELGCLIDAARILRV
jgi:hypothetical protein